MLPKLGLFLETHSKNDCRLQYYKEYGLLCGKDAFYAAFSPDAIAVLLIPYVGQVTALVEIKSKCSTATVHLHEDAKDSYQLALQEVYERYLTWIPTGKLPACLERCTLPRYACDADTIGGALGLWTAIANLVKERGRPLPEGRTLIPTIVAMWNRNKGPIDVFSRFMKNGHSQHGMLSAVGNIWLRLLMT